MCGKEEAGRERRPRQNCKRAGTMISEKARVQLGGEGEVRKRMRSSLQSNKLQEPLIYLCFSVTKRRSRLRSLKHIGLREGEKETSSGCCCQQTTRPILKELSSLTTATSQTGQDRIDRDSDGTGGFANPSATEWERARPRSMQIEPLEIAEDATSSFVESTWVDIGVLEYRSQGNKPWSPAENVRRTISSVHDELRSAIGVPKTRHVDALVGEQPRPTAVPRGRRNIAKRGKVQFETGALVSGRRESVNGPSWLGCGKRITGCRSRQFILGGVSEKHIAALLASLPRPWVRRSSPGRPKKAASHFLPAQLCADKEGTATHICVSNNQICELPRVLAAASMVSQFCAFREPVSDLGQGVLPGRNMNLPRKEGSDHQLMQSDAVMRGPATPEKPQKRRRNSPTSIQDHEFRGIKYTGQLPHGRLSNGSFHSASEPYLPADIFCHFNRNSLQRERGGPYFMDLESSCGPGKTPQVDSNNARVDSAGRRSNTYPVLAMADPFGYANGDHSTHHGNPGGRSFEAEPAAFTTHASAYLQAQILNQAGGLNAYSGSEGQVQGSPHVGAVDLCPNVSTPTFICGGPHPSPSLFTVPRFGSAATSLGDAIRSRLAESFVPSSSGLNCQSNAQLSWDLTSQACVSLTLNSSVKLVADVPVSARTPTCQPQFQPQRTETQRACTQRVIESNPVVTATPERNHEGRGLQSYTLTPGQSVHNTDTHDAFVAIVAPQESCITQRVQLTVDSNIREDIQEYPWRERLSQTNVPPPIAAEGGNRGKELGRKFTSNEVPGAHETTPKSRKKYKPRVAKDKRVYKPCTSKMESKMDHGRRMDSGPDGSSIDTYAAESGGAVLKRNHTRYSMTNGDGRDPSYPDDVVEFGNGGVGFTPATPASLENAAYSANIRRHTTDDQNTPEVDELSPPTASEPFNMGHQYTTVRDCEACTQSILETRMSGKGFRTRREEQANGNLLSGAEAHVVESSVRKQQHTEARPNGRSSSSQSPAEVSLHGRLPVQLSGTGIEHDEISSLEVWNDGRLDFSRESILSHYSSLGTDGVSLSDHLHWVTSGASSAVTIALDDDPSKRTASIGLSYMKQCNSYNDRPLPRCKSNFFNRSYTSDMTEEYFSRRYPVSADSQVRDDSGYSAAHRPLMQANHTAGGDAFQPEGMNQHTNYGGPQEVGISRNHPANSLPIPVRRSLMAQLSASPTAPEERLSLSCFPASGFDGLNQEYLLSQLKGSSDFHSSSHQETYVDRVWPCQVDQPEPPPRRSSCLKRLREISNSLYGGTADLTRMRDMVAQRSLDGRLISEHPNSLFQQLDPNTALSPTYKNAEDGAFVPENARFGWNPYFPHPNLQPRSKPFPNRLCPRGILSPQQKAFRMMTKIQRVVYLKTILMSHQLEKSPVAMRLLHHVHEHLPGTEKDAFKFLWPLILEPVTREQLEQLTDLAQETEETMTCNMEITEYQVDNQKQRAWKKPSSKGPAQMVEAMTLWSDMMEQTTTPKATKEKGDSKDSSGHEGEKSNGSSQQPGLELVVAYDSPFLPLRKRKPRPKVVLDTETVRVWKLLMGKTAGTIYNGSTDAKTELKWEEGRRIMKAQAETFIKRMHLVQGDRSFSCWKGSVVDSVVGAFLTQNVSDVLSSSAFMCIRARFPGQRFRGPLQSKDPDGDIQILGNEAGMNATPTLPFESAAGLHEAATSHGATTENILSVEGSRPDSLQSQEIFNGEESCTTHLEVRQEEDDKEDSRFWLLEGRQTPLTPSPLQQQQIVTSQLCLQAAANTSLVGSENSSSAVLSFHINVANCTEHTSTEESTTDGANVDSLQLDSLSVQHAGKNSVQEITAAETDVGSELVQHSEPGHRFNFKGLRGPERARLEAQQVSARKPFDWEAVREKFNPRSGMGEESRPAAAAPPRTEMIEDGVDWEAVHRADVEEVAAVIKERGMNWILAGRIKAFLERLRLEHGAIDLEWLRSIPTDDAKDFLLSIRGLGLKSVECIRLLTLHHLAFPVDTNVGRICVRLGWVPLEPLPEELQLHLLELYPVQATIQKYLWPRLCTLDQQTLYELHYQMITFGKVFCTKSKPNCNACPMKSDCKHFASALASAKLALPASERPDNGPTLALPSVTSTTAAAGEEEGLPQTAQTVQSSMAASQYCQPIVEEPMTPESEADVSDYDIEDYPFSVEVEKDSIMDFYIQETNPGQAVQQDTESIPNSCCCCTSNLSVTVSESEPVEEMILEDWGGLAMPSDPMTCSPLNSHQYHSSEIKIVESTVVDPQEGSQSTALLVPDAPPSQELVLLPPEAASIPVPKLKNIGRLRTVHYVYELPDHHPLLEGMDTREADDPCCYLLAIWNPGEVPESIPVDNNEENPFASSSFEGEAESIQATLLVPCRTAMQGSFPLNGTYFQVNEVFADHASSLQPILVPRTLLWNLRRRFVYFGTSVTSIFRGLTVEEIQACFWRGYVCVRGFHRSTRAPKPLVGRLHLQAPSSGKVGAPTVDS